MSDKPWKAYERQIAAMFGGKRALQKGTKEKADIVNLDGSDMPWVIDAKLQSKLRVWEWMEELVEHAQKTNRPAILVFREFKKRGSYAVVEREWFFEQFNGLIGLYSLQFWNKNDRDGFPAAMVKARKAAGDNRIPGLLMSKEDDELDYVCIRAANLHSMMIGKGLINVEDS